MTKVDGTKTVVDLLAGLACLLTGTLTAWNMAGAGVSAWRITTALFFVLMGVYLLVRYFKANQSESRLPTDAGT